MTKLSEKVLLHIGEIMEEKPRESITIEIPREVLDVECIRGYLEGNKAASYFSIVEDEEKIHLNYIPNGGSRDA